MNFERGIDPKKSIGIGKKSTQYFNRLDEGAKRHLQNVGPNCIDERDTNYINKYTRLPPNIQEIVCVWVREDSNYLCKFILYDEILYEDNCYGMTGFKKGDIFPWIFKIETDYLFGPHARRTCRYPAESFLDPMKWWQEITF